MNLENLHNYTQDFGNTIKNYKQMCFILEDEIKSGNAKKAELKTWKQYFNFYNEGQKYIIVEIYEALNLKDDNRSIYSSLIEVILSDILIKEPSHTLRCTKSQLFNLLGMANSSYSKNRMEVKDDEIKRYNDWYIRDFYVHTNRKLSQITESALLSMKKRCLIDYTQETMISENNISRIANNDDKEKLLEVKSEILNEMNYKKIPLYRFNDFYKKVNEKLKERYNWNYSYEEYNITYTQKYLLKFSQNSSEEIQNMKRQLNTSVIKFLDCQAEEFYFKNKQEGFSLKFCVLPEYVEIRQELNNILLKIQS